MVSSTITLDKKSSSSSSSTATAAATASAQQQASSSAEQNNIISIPLNAATTTSNGDALNLSEQKISILFPKCKPRTAAEQHYSGGNFASVVNNNSSGGYGMSTTATNSKSDTSSSLTTPTSLTSSSYKPYGATESGTMRGAGVSGSGGSGYDLLKSDSSSRINNNPYEGSRLGRHATSSVDKYSFYYNNQPPPLSTSPTENNANNATAASQFLPTDDEEEEEDLRKSSYPQSRHSYYTSRQSHYYNLPKQDPAGTPSNVAPSRYHWDLSYSQPVASTQSSSSAAVKHASLKSTYSKVLQSPLEDESDIEDKLKYFNYQNEMHNSSSSTAIKAGGEKPNSLLSGIYSNYKTNEMIVFSDIDEERRRVQQQEAGGSTGLHVSAVDNLNDGVMAHNQHHYQQQQESNDGVVASGGSSSKTSSSVLAGKMEESSGNAHKSMANNSGSNIMEYEGSPRRFGLNLNEDSNSSYYISSNFKLNLTSPSLLTPPRPGFPQRVIPSQQSTTTSTTSNNNGSSSTATTPTPTSNHYHPARSPTLLEQVSSGLNSSVTFDANALLSEFDAKRAAVSITNSMPSSDSNSKLNVLRLDGEDYRRADEQKESSSYMKRISPETKPTLGLTSTTADDNPTFGAGSFTTPITASSTFDYLYEFSETRKVLEEFFKCPTTEDVEKAFEKFSDYNESGDDVESLDIQYEYPTELDSKALETTYIGVGGGGGPEQTGGSLLESVTARAAGATGRKSPINNNNHNASDVDGEIEDDGCDGSKASDAGGSNSLDDEENDDEDEDEDDDDLDITGTGSNNLKYMINVKSKPRIKNGYSSFRKKKQEKKLNSVGGGMSSGIVAVTGDNNGEDEEEIDIYSANHHHHHHSQQQQQQHSFQQQQRLQHQELPQMLSRQHVTPQQQQYQDHERHFSLYLDPGSRASSCDVINESNLDSTATTQFIMNGNGKKLKTGNTGNGGGGGSGKKPLTRRHSKNFNYSPDTTDYESNCGDYDSEISLKYGSEYGTAMANGAPGMTMCDDLNNGVITSSTGLNSSALNGTIGDSMNNVNNSSSAAGTNNYTRYYTSMPVLEDGLSSGHVSDAENNNPGTLLPTPDIINSSHKLQQQQQQQQAINSYNNLLTSPTGGHPINSAPSPVMANNNLDGLYGSNGFRINGVSSGSNGLNVSGGALQSSKIFKNRDPELESLYTINTIQSTPPPPAPAPHRKSSIDIVDPAITLQQLHSQQSDVQAALKDIRTCLQRNKTLPSPTQQPQLGIGQSLQQQQQQQPTVKGYDKHTITMPVDKSLESPVPSISPVWIPRSTRDGKLVALSPTPTTKNPSPGLLLPTTPTGPTERSTNMASEKDSLLHGGTSAKNLSALDDDEDPDTDLETDRLLGHQRLDDQGFYDDNSKSWTDRKTRSILHKLSPKQQTTVGAGSGVTNSSQLYGGGKPNNNQGGSLLRQSLSTLLSPTSAVTSAQQPVASQLPELVTSTKQASPAAALLGQSQQTNSSNNNNLITTNTSGNLINLNGPNDGGSGSPEHSHQPSPIKLENNKTTIESASPNGSNNSKSDTDKKKKSKNKEVLIEGVLFRARYLGSTQLVCEGQPTKSTRMMQAEEAVSRIKALSPDGEPQPSTEVDLFISTEKIMVLNTDLKEIMMDHALRTISYIADIGDLVVLMARRRFVPQEVDSGDSGGGTATNATNGNQSGASQTGTTPPQKTGAGPKGNRTPKMICHVFESEEAQFIAQSIGQAFQVAYMEFLKANGIEDHSFMKEMDYQEVLNSQEIFGDELEIFAKKELQKEVVVPKAKGEILGVVIVESGWGSMLPTVVIANLASAGAAARCGQLNIGDQIIAINGLSLVGLPLSTCQSYIKNTKNQTVVKFTVVPCAPVVEVKIKRPNTKYQLGFSVQNGVICSLLRGGIAERGGVRVGHRIIEINNQSVVAVPHEKIVNLLATSVGEILMKTMPTSMFRLLTGQENPVYI